MSDRSLASVANELVTDHGYEWARARFKATIGGFVRAYDLERVLEIGGGRNPTFSRDEATALGIDYAINDISKAELVEGPPDFASDHRLLFDISGPISQSDDYDLVFSKMVLEHVTDGLRAHCNTFQLLRPGGVAMHFYPTLYSANPGQLATS